MAAEVSEYKQQSGLLTLLNPRPYLDYPLNSYSSTVDAEEIRHFKKVGFIVKRNLIKQHSQLNRIVDHVWKTVPAGVMTRDQPQSWFVGTQERWPLDRQEEIGALHHSNWKMRSKEKIGRERFMLELTANHPAVQTAVRSLLGEGVRICERVRGVYVVLPKPPSRTGQLGPHVDHAAAQLCAMVLVDDVPPQTGGFTVWPGSHIALHEYWESCFGAHFNPARKDEFDAEFQRILREIEPVEFVGEAGDVVFWHPRLIHSAGVNYSADSAEPRIRVVVPCDFQKDGRQFFDDDVLGPGPDKQWWVDTRHFRGDPVPTKNNIWNDWEI